MLVVIKMLLIAILLPFDVDDVKRKYFRRPFSQSGLVSLSHCFTVRETVHSLDSLQPSETVNDVDTVAQSGSDSAVTVELSVSLSQKRFSRACQKENAGANDYTRLSTLHT